MRLSVRPLVVMVIATCLAGCERDATQTAAPTPASAAGKPFKVAIVAVTRKLLIHLNCLMADLLRNPIAG